MDDAVGSASLSRAGLLKLGAATALTVGLTPTGEALARRAEAVPRIDPATPWYLRVERYVPHIGELFRVGRDTAEPLVVRLVTVQRLTRNGDAFSLVFRGAQGDRLESGIHPITNRSLGSFSLFLAQIGRGIDGQGFQAIVNRSG